MVPTNDAALRVAVDRLEWALQGLVARRESFESMLRALDACQRALIAHAAFWETPQRFFALVDPTLLPFNALQQRVVHLRDEHISLQEQLVRLRAGIQLDPVTSISGSSGPVLGGETHLTLHRLCEIGEQLCSSIREHCTGEHTLLSEPLATSICDEY
jgi:hypothetical protein